MEKKILGVCPTCYLIVTNQDTYVLLQKSDETIAYHKECEPNRMKYMRNNKERWKEEGAYFKKLREEISFSIAEIAEYLNISESKLRKFEKGEPVTHAGLLKMALLMFYEREKERIYADRKKQ